MGHASFSGVEPNERISLINKTRMKMFLWLSLLFHWSLASDECWIQGPSTNHFFKVDEPNNQAYKQSCHHCVLRRQMKGAQAYVRDCGNRHEPETGCEILGKEEIRCACNEDLCNGMGEKLDHTAHVEHCHGRNPPPDHDYHDSSSSDSDDDRKRVKRDTDYWCWRQEGSFSDKFDKFESGNRASKACCDKCVLTKLQMDDKVSYLRGCASSDRERDEGCHDHTSPVEMVFPQLKVRSCVCKGNYCNEDIEDLEKGNGPKVKGHYLVVIMASLITWTA